MHRSPAVRGSATPIGLRGACLLVVVALACSGTAAGEGDAWVERRPVSRRHLSSGKHAGTDLLSQDFRFDLGASRYAIRHIGRVPGGQRDIGAVLDGRVGMPSPTSCNWYHSEFILLHLNGRRVHGPMRYRGMAVERGRRAVADIVWQAEGTNVRHRFLGLRGEDRLYCEVRWEAKEPLRSARVVLRCYPSFFTAWHKREGNRRVFTPSGTVEQGQRREVGAEAATFAVYYDTVFDVARGEGEGPCAMMLRPEGIRSVRFQVGGYAVDTVIECDPGVHGLRFALWEFPQVPNSEVLASFRRHADAWREQLAELDFTPSILRTLDPKSELAALSELTRSAEVRQRFGERVEAMRKRFAALEHKRLSALDIADEADLLDFLPAYRAFLWDLKLTALLAD